MQNYSYQVHLFKQAQTGVTLTWLHYNSSYNFCSTYVPTNASLEASKRPETFFIIETKNVLNWKTICLCHVCQRRRLGMEQISTRSFRGLFSAPAKKGGMLVTFEYSQVQIALLAQFVLSLEEFWHSVKNNINGPHVFMTHL